MAATNGSTMVDSQTPGNLFPSCKLKGNHTFTTQAATVRNEEDPGVKPEGEGEIEPSVDEDVEVLGSVGETDQSIEHIVHFAKAVELYQKKNKDCFGYGSADHLKWDFPKDISRSALKAYLNMMKGMANKGGWAPQKPAATQWVSLHKMSQA